MLNIHLIIKNPFGRLIICHFAKKKRYSQKKVPQNLNSTSRMKHSTVSKLKTAFFEFLLILYRITWRMKDSRTSNISQPLREAVACDMMKTEQ